MSLVKTYKNIRPEQLFKLEKGQWITVYPMGYKVLQKERFGKFNLPSEVVLDEERAPMITDMFETFSKGGHSLNSMPDYLHDKYKIGIHRSSLHRMMRNKFYIGIMVWKGYEFPHNYPTLTTPEIFEKCQEVLENNTRYKKHIPIDKSLWAEGAWKHEPDYEEFSYKGITCEIRRHVMGHLCGYITIPYRYMNDLGIHKQRTNEEWWDDRIKVHGFITFFQYYKWPHRLKIGFDCSHTQDFIPSLSIGDPETLKKNVFRTFPPEADKNLTQALKDMYDAMRNGTYRDIEFVRSECRSMVDQLEKLGEANKGIKWNPKVW